MAPTATGSCAHLSQYAVRPVSYGSTSGRPRRASDARSNLGHGVQPTAPPDRPKVDRSPKSGWSRNASDRIHTFRHRYSGTHGGCCRCHDHKYDPISMRDYYRSPRSSIRSTRTACTTATKKCRHHRCYCRRLNKKHSSPKARANVVECEKTLTKTIAAGHGPFRSLVGKAIGRRRTRTYPLFHLRRRSGTHSQRSSWREGRRQCRRPTSVEDTMEKAIRFDGDRGADIADVFNVDRWTNSASTSGCETPHATPTRRDPATNLRHRRRLQRLRCNARRWNPLRRMYAFGPATPRRRAQKPMHATNGSISL